MNNNTKITDIVYINLPNFTTKELSLPLAISTYRFEAITDELYQFLITHVAKLKARSKTVILLGIEETNCDYEQLLDYVEALSNDLNVVAVPSDCTIYDIFDKNSFSLMMSPLLKKYWDLTQLRNYTNLPIIVNNEEVYFTRCIYFIPSHVLTKKGKKALWNTTIEGVTEILFTSTSPYNQYQMKDFYLSCMMLYKEYVEGNKYFVSKQINKGNLGQLQEAVKLLPI